MKNQSGAVLVIALVFLLLITAIAASLMTSGSFETVIVANKLQREDVFHAAESALEQTFTNTAAFNSANGANGTVVDVSANLNALPANSGKVYRAEIEVLSGAGTKRPIPGNSFGLLKNDMYEIRADASTDDADHRVATQIVQGVTRFRPNPSNDD